MSSYGQYSKVYIKEIFDLLDEQSVPGVHSGRASLSIRREVLLRMFENLSRLLKYD